MPRRTDDLTYCFFCEKFMVARYVVFASDGDYYVCEDHKASTIDMLANEIQTAADDKKKAIKSRKLRY